ncbi:MAG: CheY-like chemotaxis protein [Lentimonas sp.]|jgi:CheY-like chemotaxis protein
MTYKAKILFVEDEIDIRETIAGVLESENYEVFQAENGKQGLEVFLTKKPDLVISDIMMPEIDGYQLLKLIRENKHIENSNAPFILLTALGQKEDVIKGINLEASDYLIKPIDFDLLLAKIKEKISSHTKNKKKLESNITNIKSQVSNIVPGEMLQYVGLINQISGILKAETYGPLPHQKYVEGLNKIYLNSLKLKTTVDNLFNETVISNQIDVQDQIIAPVTIIKNFISSLNHKFQSQIELSRSKDSYLSDIKINQEVFLDIIRKIIGSILKTNDKATIRISPSEDHLGRSIFIFYPNVGIDKNLLEKQIEKSVSRESLTKQGLDLEITDNDKVGVILSVPDYRTVKKKTA